MFGHTPNKNIVHLWDPGMGIRAGAERALDTSKLTPPPPTLMQKDKGSVHVSGLILTGRSVQWVVDEVSNESTKAPTRNENSWTVR